MVEKARRVVRQRATKFSNLRKKMEKKHDQGKDGPEEVATPHHPE
jgi:hypothetical protein